MADNVQITAGSGTVIGTETATVNSIAVQLQQVKAVLGARDGYTGSQGGRVVDGTTDTAAGYTDNRAKVVSIAQTPTISTSPAYTAKDAIGGLLTFANAVRASGGTGKIAAVQIEDKGQQKADIDLVLFNATITAPTDNAIFNPSDAEVGTCVGYIPIGGGMYSDFSTNSVANAIPGLEFVLAGTSLFGVLVARSTPTYTSTTDIVVTLTIQQD